MKFGFIGLVVGLICSITADGQRCIFDHHHELTSERANVPARIMASAEPLARSTVRSTITLPVVVHVLYRTDRQNISKEQIQSQIDVLNEDFRANNDNIGSTPRVFSDLVADVGIEFCLAANPSDPLLEKGITRTSTTLRNAGLGSSFYKTAEGGTNPWDPQKYINIYVCELPHDILGYASDPTMQQEFDGIVIHPQYFGRTGTAQASAPFDLGRTLTHEMGHYLGLLHPWGRDQSSCAEGDNIEDTPPQETWNQGCPNYPVRDLCSPGPQGVMFNNFMDYTDDKCSTFFTHGQKERMHQVLQQLRPGLLDGMLCEGTSIQDLQNHIQISFSMDDHSIYLEGGDAGILNLSIISISGQEVWSREVHHTGRSVLQLAPLTKGVYAFFIRSEQQMIKSTIFVMP